MDLGLAGKKAIICASSQGLGKACAMALAYEGVSVVINGRDPAVLQDAATEIRRSARVEVTPVAADITTHEGQALLLSACPEPDILINNNAGPPFRDFRNLDRDAMVAGLVMNMIVPIELMQKVVDSMVSRGFGRIVNITSVGVKMPLEGLDLSSAARAGLTAFVAGIARSVAANNVTINNLLPGYFGTSRLRAGFAAAAERTGSPVGDVQAEWQASVPAQRFGVPSELGAACAFLCSNQAAFITGQSLLVDGGLFRGIF
jgi:3-oxoacyl-[acyl-carrier protein] reductase